MQSRRCGRKTSHANNPQGKKRTTASETSSGDLPLSFASATDHGTKNKARTNGDRKKNQIMPFKRADIMSQPASAVCAISLSLAILECCQRLVTLYPTDLNRPGSLAKPANRKVEVKFPARLSRSPKTGQHRTSCCRKRTRVVCHPESRRTSRPGRK